MIHNLILTLLFSSLLYACWTDLHSFRIPNSVPVSVALLFAAFALESGMSLHDLAMHGLAAALVLATTFALYAAGSRFGGGDAKLLSAVSLWCGLSNLLALLVNVSLVGGGLALAVVMARRTGFSAMAMAHGWKLPLFGQADGKCYIPYALAITAGFTMLAL
jgi:prepilin peptidase CpaA